MRLNGKSEYEKNDKLAENAEKEAIPLIHDHFKSKYGIEVEVKSVLASFSGCSHDSDRCFDGVVNATVIYKQFCNSAGRTSSRLEYRAWI